jgi:hypothetical protein
MRFRKLRIAWSVGCGIACVLLIALWVRSHFVLDWVGRGDPTSSEITVVSLISDNGTLVVAHRTELLSQLLPAVTDGWTYMRFPRKYATDDTFDWKHDDKGFLLRFPMLILAMLFVATAVGPWLIRWRFTLRTLLIATTLVAVVLGFIVAMLRWPAG